MIRRLVHLMLCSCVLVGGTAGAADDGEPSSTAKAFHSKSLGDGQAYKLLSSAMQKQWSEAAFVGSRARSLSEPEGLKVLSTGVEDSRAYSKVVLTYLDSSRGCRVRETETWIQEDGGWRLFSLQPLIPSGDAVPQRHDMPRLRLRDPNPADDAVVVNAIRSASSEGAARESFGKLSADSCMRVEAVITLVERMGNTEGRLALLEKEKAGGPLLIATRIKTLSFMSRDAEAMALLKEHGKAIAEALSKRVVPQYRLLDLGAEMGIIAVKNGDEAEGRKWLEATVALDPRSREPAPDPKVKLTPDEEFERELRKRGEASDPKGKPLRALRMRLDDPCCNQFAARFSVPRVSDRAGGGSSVFVTLENLSPVRWGYTLVRAQVKTSKGTWVEEQVGVDSFAAGQTRELEIPFPSLPKANVTEIKMLPPHFEVLSPDPGVAGWNFWVKMAPPATSKSP